MTDASTPPPSALAPRKPDSFTGIIDLWPGKYRWRRILALARDMDMPGTRIDQWYVRKFVPLKHWEPLIAAVREVHGIELTLDDLYAMARDSEHERAPSDKRSSNQDTAA